MFRRALDPRVASRLAAVSLARRLGAIKSEARGLSKTPHRCERKTVSVPCLSMAETVGVRS